MGTSIISRFYPGLNQGSIFWQCLLLANAIWIGQAYDFQDLPKLDTGRTKAQNALWIENDLSARFNTSTQVVVANLTGPGVVTMIHFAMPQALKLNRDVLLRMYWDNEWYPSVDVPLVDFFCDPAGLREEVNTAFVNKRRGYNAYFPMPFRESGKIELVYDGPIKPGDELWKIMPCYSYVMYRTLPHAPSPAECGYFHASWRQEGLLLGKEEYLALEAKGKGKFVGWNVTMRLPGRDSYPVDQNETFYIDGESAASVEFQGIEDSFGFSWGFPPTESQFPLTGFYKFYKGAAAYRFFPEDYIRFDQSLRVLIGFGEKEDPLFRREFSKRGNTMQFSSTVYWYQTEPHAPLPDMPGPTQRVPAPERLFWPEKETLPSAEALRGRRVKLHMLCGRPEREVVFAEEGFGAVARKGYAWNGWEFPVYHCRAGNDEVDIELTVPKGARGTVRVYIIDPDKFEGGRKQTMFIGGESVGTAENFEEGRWIERRLSASDTASGKVSIKAINARQGSNAVISTIEWIADSE